MPNIGTLPGAKDLVRAKSPVPLNYGPRCTVTFYGDSDTVVLSTPTHRVLVVASAVETNIALDLLTAQTVPYVNAFIADHGQRVEKNWRTKAYRVIGPDAHVSNVVAEIEVSEPETEVSEPEVKYLSVVASNDDAPTHIPGVEYPTKVKVKSAGKGWSQVGDIIVPDEDLATLRDAWQLRQSGVPSAVLITGPSGTAKTALVRAFAASLEVPFLKVDASTIRTADDWSGSVKQDRATKTWSHQWSPMAQVLRRGQPAVILIDDFTRTESPQAANALIGLLDWTAQLLVPDAGEVLRLPAGVLIVATANIGPEFVGTLPIDGAVRQRFPYGIRLGYPDAKHEAKLLVDMTGLDLAIADRLVALADSQRINRDDPGQYPSGGIISTRVILDIARRIQTCDTAPRAAVTATLRGQFDPGDEAALSVIIDAQFPAEMDVDETINEMSPEDFDRTELGAIGPYVTAAASPPPLFTTGKHYFSAYGSDCTYIHPRTHTSPPGACGKTASDPIHIGS